MRYRTTLAIMVCALLAGLFCYLCGTRGFFALDQSIVFDGAFRIFHGQAPYRDFLSPHGLFLFALQALFFALFGVTYQSYLLCAAIQNAGAVLLSCWLVRRLVPNGGEAPIVLSAVVTGIWFYAPSGTPYPEQSAMLLILGAILAVVGERSGLKAWALAGILCACAVLSKQNVALFSLPLFFALLIVRSAGGPSTSFVRFLGFMGGTTVIAAPVWILLSYFGGSSGFWQSVIVTPGELATRRAHEIVGRAISLPGICIGALLVIASLLILYRMRATQSDRIPHSSWAFAKRTIALDPERQVSCVVVLGGLLLLSLLLRETTFNNPALSSLNLGLILGLMWGAWRSRGLPYSFFELLLAGGTTASAITIGVAFSWYRLSQESVAWSSFPSPLPLPGFESLWWGQPTKVRGHDIAARDITRLVAFLKLDDEPFFIFPDHTIVYAMVGRPAPQPLLWFHRGLTYPFEDHGETATAMVSSLKLHSVRRIVVERHSFFGTDQHLRALPQFLSYLEECYSSGENFGTFEVYERKASPSPRCDVIAQRE